MRNAQPTYGFMWSGYENLHLTSLLCPVLLVRCSRAQDASDSTSIFLTSSVPTAGSVRSMMTLATASFASNTTSSSSSLATGQTPPDIFPAATPPHDNGTPNNAVFNYYFLFLALFSVLVAALLWWLHRQKKRRKELTRLSGQHALARDMEGWASTRRFMHGRYARRYHAAFLRREEGLDEHGYAPPPYQPKGEQTEVQGTAETAQAAASLVTIPSRTLSRDEAERLRPPAYSSDLHP